MWVSNEGVLRLSQVARRSDILRNKEMGEGALHEVRHARGQVCLPRRLGEQEGAIREALLVNTNVARH